MPTTTTGETRTIETETSSSSAAEEEENDVVGEGILPPGSNERQEQQQIREKEELEDLLREEQDLDITWSCPAGSCGGLMAMGATSCDFAEILCRTWVWRP